MAAIKSYNISAIGKDVEFGKSGGRLVYDRTSGTFEFVGTHTLARTRIKISNGIDPNDAVNLSQLESLTLQDVGAGVFGEELAQSDDVSDAKALLGIRGEGAVSSFIVMGSDSLLEPNFQYFLTGSATYTLPDTTTLVSGSVINVRSKIGDSPTITVYDELVDLIITETTQATSILMDKSAIYSLLFNGLNWELIL